MYSIFIKQHNSDWTLKWLTNYCRKLENREWEVS